MSEARVKENTRRYAESYLRRGLSVVPIPEGRKRPVIPSWQTLRLRLEEYERILKERAEEGYRRDVHPMLRYYVENGARSMGDGMRFASLKRRCAEDYIYLMEEKVQRRLF